MDKNILLSPLGRSPGAVTGIYYALQKSGTPIHAVTIVTTAMQAVQDAADMVRRTIGPHKVYILQLRSKNENATTVDFDNDEVAEDFIRQINAVLVQARQEGDRVYLGISGGRSSMGALAALSAYVYGAAGVYHLWVDEEIEKHGDIYNLLPLGNPQYYLEPPPEKYRLVGLPLHTFDELILIDQIHDFAVRHPTLVRAVSDVEMIKVSDLALTYRAGQTGIPKELYRSLQETLLRCAPLDNDATLRAFFAVKPLAPWQNQIPEAQSRKQRATLLLNFLTDQVNVAHESVLILFLRELFEQADSGTACKRELQARLRSLGEDVPSLTVDPSAVVSNEEVEEQLQKILHGTELAPLLDRAIELAKMKGQGTNTEAILTLAERLKPHYKPGLWVQVQQDLNDWNSWKAGADRLLSFVEAVGTPLAIAGLAAMLGITSP